MTHYRCDHCGKTWSDGPIGGFEVVYHCTDCVPLFYARHDAEFYMGQVKEKPPVSDAETKYYKTLCSIQKELIEKMHQYIHDQNRPQSIDAATHREWSLATQLGFAQQDNKALRELCEEYRAILKEYQNAAN